MLESLLDDDHDMDCMYLGRRAEMEAIQAQMVRLEPHTAHVHHMCRFSSRMATPAMEAVYQVAADTFLFVILDKHGHAYDLHRHNT
jgi:hypothetical protein